MLVVLAVVAGAVGVFALTRKDEDDNATQAPGEVFLEPARYAGQDPFSSDVDKLVTEPTPVIFPASTTSTAKTATTAATPASTTSSVASPTTTAPAVSVQAAPGTTPGLYGGTRNAGTCDVAAIDAFLQQNPDKAAAWAGALGIGTGEISTFLRKLTPVVLLADTRVTNHGFRDGRATPLQSVLQAGTAVLVDATGVPRVKCACGNPLKEPVAQSEGVQYTGYRWPSFDPARTAVVSPGPTTDRLVLQDLAGGAPFERPVGSAGTADRAAAANVIATIPRVGVSIPPTSTTIAAASTTRAGSTTTRGGATTAPTATVLPAGDFCTRVKAYEATLDRDFTVDTNWRFSSGKTDAEFGLYLDAALRELAAVAPANVAADVKTVSDWWQPTMGVRDLFGAGVPIPTAVKDAIQRMNTVLETGCPK